jgi:hypothetical protein
MYIYMYIYVYIYIYICIYTYLYVGNAETLSPRIDRLSPLEKGGEEVEGDTMVMITIPGGGKVNTIFLFFVLFGWVYVLVYIHVE